MNHSLSYYETVCTYVGGRSIQHGLFSQSVPIDLKVLIIICSCLLSVLVEAFVEYDFIWCTSIKTKKASAASSNEIQF